MSSLAINAAIISVALGLNCVADLSAQRLSFVPHAKQSNYDTKLEEEDSSVQEENFTVDWARTGRWLLWPSLPNVMTTTFMYGKMVPFIFGDSTSPTTFILKLMVRAGSHMAAACVSMVGNRLIADDSIQAIALRMQKYLLPCAVWNCIVWLPADILQFLLVPAEYQVLWIYLYNLVAGTILSYFVNITLPQEDRLASPGRPKADDQLVSCDEQGKSKNNLDNSCDDSSG